MVKSLTPQQLAALLAAGEPLVLVDVRLDRELAICAIDGAAHIPLHELEERFDELDRGSHIVCVCHHGMRSAGAAAFLESQAFASISNLEGGIDAWAREVDRAMPRY